MNMIAAAEATMEMARPWFEKYPDLFNSAGPDCSPRHLEEMLSKMRAGDMSEGKLGRWLGWMQCAIVAAGVGIELDDMKEINKRYIEPAIIDTQHTLA
jgi:hypothetical protein